MWQLRLRPAPVVGRPAFLDGRLSCRQKVRRTLDARALRPLAAQRPRVPAVRRAIGAAGRDAVQPGQGRQRFRLRHRDDGRPRSRPPAHPHARQRPVAAGRDEGRRGAGADGGARGHGPFAQALVWDDPAAHGAAEPQPDGTHRRQRDRDRHRRSAEFRRDAGSRPRARGDACRTTSSRSAATSTTRSPASTAISAGLPSARWCCCC